MALLQSRWALVTGSSRGIGREIAVGLARLGANIIVHARELTHTDATLAQVRALGVEAFAVAGEMDSAAGVDSVVRQVFSARPAGIDILYNNAAINNQPTAITEFSAAEWQRTFQINLFAPITLCNAFVPLMLERNFGRVVNITSGIENQPELAPYSASKAALDKYTRDLACACAGKNVLINRVDPGWIRTDLGGPDAWEAVDSVIPGVLVPALLPEEGPRGRLYAAQDYKNLWQLAPQA